METQKTQPVKLIIGILAADEIVLNTAVKEVISKFGSADFLSDIWPFTMTDYYKHETGDNILKQFVSIESLIHPGKLAKIKHRTNRIEKRLAKKTRQPLPRPVNIDPGIIEPSKLILATTKNFAHRVYIGRKMYAEVTLMYSKGTWQDLPYTFADYKQQCYQNFLSKVRTKLVEQLRSLQ